MEFLSAFGKAVRAVRLRLEWSQEDLAYAADLDRTYVSGLERGRRNPTLITQRQLANAMGTPLSELIRSAEHITGRSKP